MKLARCNLAQLSHEIRHTHGGMAADDTANQVNKIQTITKTNDLEKLDHSCFRNGICPA